MAATAHCGAHPGRRPVFGSALSRLWSGAAAVAQFAAVMTASAVVTFVVGRLLGVGT